MATETVNPINGDSNYHVSIDKVDELTEKLAKLAALLHMTYGDAESSFNRMNDNLRNNFLWACSGLADDCEAIALMMAGGDTTMEVAHD